MTEATPCPCISGEKYSECCQPLHEGKQHAKTAEQLMRSRYSAFYLGLVDYLIETLATEQRKSDDQAVLQNTIDNTQWLGLKILKHQQKAEQAFVEFIAFYQDEGIAQLHERSSFIKKEGKWFYQTGEFLPAIKLGRNEECFCGSGKKLKRCHAL